MKAPVNNSTCSGCDNTYSDKVFDLKQLSSIYTPLLCPKCLSASVHIPERERVDFLKYETQENYENQT